MIDYYIALIPAYMPDPILLDILRQLQAEEFHIVVVDDGSGSNYVTLFEEASCFATVLTHDVNQGKGAALKTGLSYIQSNLSHNSVIVTLDADGQHSVEDALKLCKFARQYPDELILGSRKRKGKVPLRSQFGNTVTRFVYRISTGLKIYDTQTGLRAFHSKLLPEMLSVSGERYEYEMNVLLNFARRDIPIREVEIRTIYIEKNSSSHFHVMRDSYRIYKEIIKFSASSLIGFLVDYALYSMLLILTSGNLRLSNICARIVSSITNYVINRKFVFKSKTSVIKSGIPYFLLATIILFGNTVVLEVLVKACGIHRMIAKIITEILFFTLSWGVQRFIVFAVRTKEKGGEVI